jgi:hypothetical protein
LRGREDRDAAASYLVLDSDVLDDGRVTATVAGLSCSAVGSLRLHLPLFRSSPRGAPLQRASRRGEMRLASWKSAPVTERRNFP